MRKKSTGSKKEGGPPKKRGVPLVYGTFALLLPKEHREEYLGDVLELRSNWKKEGRTRTSTEVGLFLQFLLLVVLLYKGKIDEYFEPTEEREIDE